MTAPPGELAEAARACRAITQALRLARWVGPGRQLTPTGALRPSDASEAAKAVGITAPAKVQRAAHIPQLHTAWRIALAAHFLEREGRTVRPGPALHTWPGLSAAETLQRWLDGFRAALTDDGDDAERDELALTVLSVLDTDPASSDLASIAQGVHQFLFHSEHRMSWTLPPAYLRYDEPIPTMLDRLSALGAVDGVRLTPLGRWALEQSRPPRITPGMDAAELIAALEQLDPSDAAALAGPWLDARTPLEAARQLLAVAATATPRLRITAMSLVNLLEEGTGPAWLEAADHPILAPIARAQLWRMHLREDLDAADLRWIAVDDCAAALGEDDPTRLLDLFHKLPGTTGTAKIESIAASGHPDRDTLIEHLRQIAAEHSAPRVFQLKVSLLGWGVWRRVLVPPTLTLGELHEVIRAVLDWDGEHLHAFTAGQRRYAPAWYDIDADDEEHVSVADVLPRDGATIGYVYDFGDTWRHEITLQKILPATPGTAYPVCVAGRGDSPIEDSWAEEGDVYPTTPYDLADINKRLRILIREPTAEGTP